MNKQMKKAASLLIVAGLLASASVQAFAHWGDDAIDYAVKNEYIASQAIEPDGTAKRYELAAAMYSLENKPEVEAGVKFDDVDAASDYAKAIAWAVQEGIIAGVEETKFDPEGGVTREMLAEILFRYGQAKKLTEVGGMAVHEFKDFNKIADWAIGGVAYCVSAGLMVGDDEGNFNPQDEMTYAQFATVIRNFAEKLNPKTETSQTAPVAEVKMYIGEVTDGTMNGVTMVAADGEKRQFNTENAKTTALGEDGIAVGDYVRITYIEKGDIDMAFAVEEIDKTDVNFVVGAVEDMSMNTLQIKAEDGKTMVFVTTYAEISGGEKGIVLGDTVSVTYAGKLERDTATKVLKVEEKAEAPENSEKTEENDNIADDQEGGVQLTLDDVVELSKKGENLSWSDFEKYESTAAGSGLYILYYAINDDYYLMIGGLSDKEKPAYIRLVKADDDEQYIDIRTQDIAEFTAK